ncbi:MAG: RNA polymerase sigma factor SigF [Actinomycetota bacterium]|nr:RNA polymerase sigma factor SigF [Actinomycetota bacterium]MDH5223955.1 RNA polymerase sigma factor SigF [Actinomycetota bacterium]MDH5313289.1 RNA polymerase sigma factor SigF [Actinomycetota bacterium]
MEHGATGEAGAARTQPDDDRVEALFGLLPDAAARDEIATRFASFAEYLARRFAGRGEPVEDLNQVAMIGLLKAIDRFDDDRGVQFSTYAAATIIGELKRHFRDKGWSLRVPRRLQELAVRVNREMPELTQKLGRSPTIPELADHLAVSTEDIAEAMDAVQAYSTASIDTPAGDDATAPIDSLGGADPSLELLEEWSTIAPAVAELSPRDRRVLYLRFFRGLTQSEIAEDIGVSQMHVSRILTQTLEKLRRAATA